MVKKDVFVSVSAMCQIICNYWKTVLGRDIISLIEVSLFKGNVAVHKG
jgi:hypothetical protein